MSCLLRSLYSSVRLRRVRLGVGRLERGEQGRVVEAPLVLLPVEEGADEVVGVGVVTGPAQQVQVVGGARLARR